MVKMQAGETDSTQKEIQPFFWAFSKSTFSVWLFCFVVVIRARLHIAASSPNKQKVKTMEAVLLLLPRIVVPSLALDMRHQMIMN